VAFRRTSSEELVAAADEFRLLCMKCTYVRVERGRPRIRVEYHIARGWVRLQGH